jgi:two-component system, sensor histidine kinase and response regulator
MQMGSIKTFSEKVSLYNIIEGVCRLHENSRIKKNIRLDMDIDDKLEVFTDKYMLISVINNLISNAIKFTFVGGNIKITSYNSDNEYVKVCVSDNGVGISQKNIEKLFKIDSSYSSLGTNDEKGTGLGLLLCKEFVERNGGKIWIDSEPGKGSNFYFSIRLN